MITDLHEVLARQRDAAVTLEARLRTVELLLTAGEPRLLPLALDEANEAAERLAALELTRVLTLGVAGAPPDVRADEVIGTVGGYAALPFAAVVDELDSAVARVSARREQVRQVVAVVRAEGEQRIAMAGAAGLA